MESPVLLLLVEIQSRGQVLGNGKRGLWWKIGRKFRKKKEYRWTQATACHFATGSIGSPRNKLQRRLRTSCSVMRWEELEEERKGGSWFDEWIRWVRQLIKNTVCGFLAMLYLASYLDYRYWRSPKVSSPESWMGIYSMCGARACVSNKLLDR